jgi:ABC-type multidrug transport system ATPase subunit
MKVETFLFHAKLKLWSLTEEQIENRCRRIMKTMNLMDCENTLVGNGQFKKSISGGQKKRLAIGVELLSDPQILIFDEPTSGLDSHNALIIVNLLKKLAKEQHKVIIATLHQPSSLMFQNLDLLYLIKDGGCVYNGRANQIIDYMGRLGININYRMNPADFFMLEMSKMK